MSDYPDETNHWKEHVIMWGKDLKRSVDYLESREDIDSEKLAFMGVSWGAAMAPIMMAIEPRIDAGIVVVAGLLFQKSLPEVDALHYLPRVTVPMLILNGKYDFFFPYETSQVPYFELLGTRDEEAAWIAERAGHPGPAIDCTGLPHAAWNQMVLAHAVRSDALVRPIGLTGLSKVAAELDLWLEMTGSERWRRPHADRLDTRTVPPCISITRRATSIASSSR